MRQEVSKINVEYGKEIWWKKVRTSAFTTIAALFILSDYCVPITNVLYLFFFFSFPPLQLFPVFKTPRSSSVPMRLKAHQSRYAASEDDHDCKLNQITQETFVLTKRCWDIIADNVDAQVDVSQLGYVLQACS